GTQFEPHFEPYVSLHLGSGVFIDPDDDPVMQLENPIGEVVIGATVGANFTDHWSAELAVDVFETLLETPAVGKIAEYAVWTVLPQLRYRWRPAPFWEPYVLAGAGLIFVEANDFAVTAKGLAFNNRKDVSFVGSVGGGADYFFADNLAFGVEAKYLYGGRTDVRFSGVERRINLDAVLVTGGLRMVFNARDRETGKALPVAHDPGRRRFYLALRAGRPFYVAREITPTLEIEPTENEAMFGFSLGVNLSRHFGVELAGEGGETTLRSSLVGDVAEYGWWTIAGQVRARYPMLEDRLAPYIVAGGGLGWGEVNDRMVPLGVFALAGRAKAVPIVTLGAGADYFLTHNIALNLEARQTWFTDRDLSVGGMSEEIDLSYFGVSAGLRVFFN
ncbi:MAG: outer membrane beta-barrel protein, partial [Alphaproteobacteria bacterium]|nr:outer membrane beta-barrel protein [Alphaproteobacteria bacterium]